MAPIEGPLKCLNCGNKTRFDVYESRRARLFHHFSLGGDLSIDEEEVLEATVDRIVCRWCHSEAVEGYR